MGDGDNMQVEQGASDSARREALANLVYEVAKTLGHDLDQCLTDEGSFLRFRAHLLSAAHDRKMADKRISDIGMRVHGNGRL